MRRFLQAQHARLGALKSSADTYTSEVLLAQNNGYRDKLEAYQLAFAKLGETASAQLYCTDLEENYGSGAILFEGVEPMLQRLAVSANLGLVSNGRDKAQRAKLKSTGIGQYFQSIVISESFGAKKPDKSLFLHALAELKATAEQSVFIGDHPDNDLKPAQELGMKTVWVKNNNYAEPDFVDAVVDSAMEVEATVLAWM